MTAPKADGCSYHDHCLTCPFSVCVHDDLGVVERERRAVVSQRVLELTDQKQPARTIARRVGVSPRTVYRMRQQRS